MKPTFAEYIVSIAKPRKNVRGEFIAYARHKIASDRFPKINTWMAVAHCFHHDSVLLNTGRLLWSEYRGYLKRQDYADRATKGQVPFRRLRGLDPMRCTEC